jgi:phenylpyruvate tautomerase PptA (4-oxalocrotonate tautomerase family)
MRNQAYGVGDHLPELLGRSFSDDYPALRRQRSKGFNATHGGRPSEFKLGADMPFYTCTVAEGTLTTESKAILAAEIARIHSEINKVPPTYVFVAISELPASNVFAGGRQMKPLVVSGWARRGHPQESTTRLALELASAGARISGVDEDHVMVVIEDGPAGSAVEGGRVLPEPGHEEEWLRRAGNS